MEDPRTPPEDTDVSEPQSQRQEPERQEVDTTPEEHHVDQDASEGAGSSGSLGVKSAEVRIQVELQRITAEGSRTLHEQETEEVISDELVVEFAEYIGHSEVQPPDIFKTRKLKQSYLAAIFEVWILGKTDESYAKLSPADVARSSNPDVDPEYARCPVPAQAAVITLVRAIQCGLIGSR